MAWSDEDKAAIKAEWLDGKTGGEIAEPRGVSRCVILGLINRMGLVRTTPQQRTMLADAKKAERIEAEAKRRSGEAERLARAAKARPQRHSTKWSSLPQIALTAAAAPPEPRRMGHVALLDLLPGDCRWPLWPHYAPTPPAAKFFCGEPAPVGQPYCRACAAKSAAPRAMLPPALRKPPQFREAAE